MVIVKGDWGCMRACVRLSNYPSIVFIGATCRDGGEGGGFLSWKACVLGARVNMVVRRVIG